MRSLRLWHVSACLLFALCLASVAASAHADDGWYFPETGHRVSGKFLQYWQQNGGLAVYGFPITDAQNEVDPETGKTFLTQWFERRRFELHPENAGTQYEVLGGLLGKDLRREALDVDPDFVRYAPLYDNAYPKEQQRYFSETGHNLRFRFLEYWQQNGGLERFGFPISELHREVDPETGKAYIVQWFERARFESHPENNRPYDVLLGLLGNQLKKKAPQFSFVWKRGAARDGMFQPQRTAVDGAGNIYVSAKNYTVIQKYDAAGHYLSYWGGNGTGDGQFHQGIGDLAADSTGFVYALDIATNSIQKFDGRGTFVARLKVADGSIQSIGLDRQNNLYAAANGTPAITVFNPSGAVLRTIAQLPDDIGQAVRPQAIAVDGQGILVIYGITSDDRKNAIFRYTAQGTFVNRFDVNENLSYSNSSIAADARGNIYVVVLFKAARIFDSTGKILATLSVAFEFGVPYVPGLLDQPEGVAVDAQGNSYFADTANNRIVKFDTNFRQSQIIGDTYSGKDQFFNPTAITVGAQNRLYVYADTANGRVQMYDATGHFLSSWQPQGVGKGTFGLNACRQGTVFVSDFTTSTIHAYDPDGRPLFQFGSIGEGAGQFKAVNGIVCDTRGNIYVGDFRQHRIQKFDNKGTFVTAFTEYYPTTLAIDNQDRMYSVESGAARVVVLNTEGTRLLTIGGPDPAVGGLQAPRSATVDSKGRIYVSDSPYNNNPAIKIFDTTGTYVGAWRSMGDADGQLTTGGGLAIDSQDNLYTTDVFLAISDGGARIVNPLTLRVQNSISISKCNVTLGRCAGLAHVTKVHISI